MLHAVKPETPAADAADRSCWREKNLAVMAAGFAWVDAALQPSDAALRDAAARRYRELRQDLREAGEPAAIDRLSAIFQLAPVDEDILLLALASQRLGQPKALTPAVAQTLLAIDGAEAGALLWERLGPSAPLRRFRFIELGDAALASHTAMVIDERIGRLLMGDATLDERVSRVVLPVNGGPCPARRAPAIERLAAALRQRPHRPLAMIAGPAHSGRRAAAQALAQHFGLGLVELKPRLVEQTPDLLPVLAREAILNGFALLIDAATPDARRLIEEHPGSFEAVVIVVAENRSDVTIDMPALQLDPLELDDRIALWDVALAAQAGRDQASALAAQFRLGPRAVAAAVAAGGDVRQACRAEARQALAPLAEHIAPRYGWDDIVLPDAIIHDLRAAAAQVRHHATVYHRHGFARKHARGQGVSVLISGPSGTGKTMAAEVIARDLDLDLYRIDLSRVVSKYIGETEKNLRAVFDAAELGGAVLFFDEADALFGKRSEVKDSHDRYANIEVSYLLQRMESYGGLAVLATNMKGHLDAAFLRRLRFVIDVPFPDAAARRLIWEKAFPAEMPRAALDFDALARLDIAGGNITVIAVNAAFLAAAEDAPLNMAHIARAARLEYRKLDRELRLTFGNEA